MLTYPTLCLGVLLVFLGVYMLRSLKRSLSSRDDVFENAHCVRARVVDAGGVISLRKHVYREAESKHAFYMEDEEGIDRDGNDLVIHLVFLTYTNALDFESAFHDLCGSLCSIEVSRRQCKVKSYGRKIRRDEDGDPVRVFRHDYDEDRTDSPDATVSHSASSQVASNFSASRQIVQHQSIESPVYVSGGEAEKCHLVPQCDLETQEEKDDEDNMFSMSPNYHKLFDGKKNLVPKMRISAANVKKTSGLAMPPVPPGRTLVWLRVEFIADWVGLAYGGFLKDGSRKISDTEFLTWVCVEYPGDFKNNLRIKYDITTKRWENGK